MSRAVVAARAALGDARVWVVGGAVRDALLERETDDVDLVVDGDVEAAARTLGRAVRGPAFPLSEDFGAWRVLGPEGEDPRWQVDLSPLHADGLEADLARRDLTVNAIAQPLQGGALVDPTGGERDLRDGLLRMVAATAFDEDPLRTLRVARLATELGMAIAPSTAQAARARAGRLAHVSPERVFAELRRIVASDEPSAGMRRLGDLGLEEVVLPELAALRGVQQNRYHHLDVHDHTLAVLDEVVALEHDPAAIFGDDGAALGAFLRAPLADGLDRAGALRLGALLHDVAKPQTQAHHEDGSVLGFPGHAEEGAEVTRDVLTRLRTSDRLRGHVAALARHHLRLGFLVHEDPLDRRAVHRYLVATEGVEVDVSLLSVADRLATRGRKADDAIRRHLDVARVVVPLALERAGTPPLAPLVRGDVLARALGIAPGPRLGALLAAIAEAQYAGEVQGEADAVALARALLATTADEPHRR